MLTALASIAISGASGGSLSGKMTRELRPAFERWLCAETTKAERHLARPTALQPEAQPQLDPVKVNTR